MEPFNLFGSQIKDTVMNLKKKKNERNQKVIHRKTNQLQKSSFRSVIRRIKKLLLNACLNCTPNKFIFSIYHKSQKLKLSFQNFLFNKIVKTFGKKLLAYVMEKKLWELFLCVCVCTRTHVLVCTHKVAH